MKGIYPITILFLSFSLTLPSCNMEGVDTVMNGDDGIYTFSFNPVESEYSQGWVVSDAIGIFAYKSGTNDIHLDHSNKRYIANEDNVFVPATSEDEMPRLTMGSTVDFTAYYPYKADITDRYIIDLRDQSSQKDVDFLFSNNASNTNNASRYVRLTFDHALSKIIINSTSGEGYTDKDLEGMSITISNVNVIAAVDIRNGDIDILERRMPIVMKQTNDLLSEAIILPVASSEVDLTIKLANSYFYETKFPGNHNFSKSTVYRYNLKINKTNVELIPTEIVDWTGLDTPPDTCISIDRMYEVGDLFPVPNDPTTAIGIVYWVKPGTEGKEGKITSLDTEVHKWSESNDFELGTSISVGTNNMTVVREIDPSLQDFPAFKWCTDKGNGWYLPARYELHIINEQWISNKEKVNNNILSAGGEIFTETDIYMASSESRSFPELHAETYDFSNKRWPLVSKTTPHRIRAVKLF